MTDQAELKREYVNGQPTEFYYCSECKELFKPNPSNHGEMRQTFRFHVAAKHKPTRGKEDVNQAAARVVREATEKY